MSIRTRLLSTVLPLALLGAAPARILLAAGAALTLLGAGAAQAEVRALLVGVSDYHYLDANLNGPKNDVRLMAGALVARGAEPGHIRILTTPGTELAPGHAPAEDPTRAAILAALDLLAAEAQPGDTVIFYYSGHGSQAPDQNGDEPDGFDQILLPSDASGWRGQIGKVENSIIDDELQAKMQAILDRGVTLVGIIDACHSATGFRALESEGVARYVSPLSLGVPEDATGSGYTGAVQPPLSGDFVFLYSSQTDERSFEYPIGDRSDPANWYGDFTRNLSAVLAEVPDLTWAQALAAASDGLRQEQASQSPDGEGTMLAAPIFGGAEAAPRMRIENGTLMAGLLSGLGEGAEVEIYDSAAGGSLLGLARVVSASATDAVLEFDGDLPATAYAELYSPGLPPPLRLAPPQAGDEGEYAAVFSVIGAIREGDLADGVEWTGPDQGYDMRLIAVDGELAVVGRDGVLDPAGPGSSPRIAADVGQDLILGFIDRAVRLHRLGMALAAAEGRKSRLGFAGVGLSVKGELLSAAGAAPEAGGVVAGITCAEPDGPAAPFADGDAAAPCDQIWLTVSNTSRTAQDVTVLYIDRDMRIIPIWPEQGLSNRVGFGGSVDIGLRIDPRDLPGGVEEIVVIAVPARDGAPRTVLTALADPDPTRSAADQPPTGDWLMAAMETDGQSRSFRPGAKPDPVKVTRMRVVLTERQ